MSKSDNDTGLMSSAGLVRYFDAEDRNTITVSPYTIIAFSAFFGLFIIILNALL